MVCFHGHFGFGIYSQSSASVFEGISIAVPKDPYGLNEKTPDSDGEDTHIQKERRLDENVDYLSPGCPLLPTAELDTRFRKISSPARTRFFQPDKDVLAKFNARYVPHDC